MRRPVAPTIPTAPGRDGSSMRARACAGRPALPRPPTPGGRTYGESTESRDLAEHWTTTTHNNQAREQRKKKKTFIVAERKTKQHCCQKFLRPVQKRVSYLPGDFKTGHEMTLEKKSYFCFLWVGFRFELGEQPLSCTGPAVLPLDSHPHRPSHSLWGGKRWGGGTP